MNDTRVLTTLSVLLGLNIENAGEDEMDTSPPPPKKEAPPRSEPKKSPPKEEKMDEDLTPEKREVTFVDSNIEICKFLFSAIACEFIFFLTGFRYNILKAFYDSC